MHSSPGRSYRNVTVFALENRPAQGNSTLNQHAVRRGRRFSILAKAAELVAHTSDTCVALARPKVEAAVNSIPEQLSAGDSSPFRTDAFALA